MRRFLNRRNLLIALGIITLVGVSAVAGLLVFVNSSSFNERVRQALIQEIENQTGAGVSVARVRWSLRQRRIVLEDLTLRGTEPQNEAPLAHIDSITAGLSLRNLIQERLDLFDLSVVNPQFRIIVNPDGTTNLPGPPKRPENPESKVSLSIRNLNVVRGSALINERRILVDFTLAQITSDMVYRNDSQVLKVTLAYDGTATRDRSKPIPYSLSSDFDFTRGTVIVQRAEVTSGKSSAKLQGRIDSALTTEISGKLEYTGTFDTAFLAHFYPGEKLGGRGKAAGALEFNKDRFSTQGNFTTDRADLYGWNATAVSAKYAYEYPEKKLTLKQVSAKALGGGAKGTITVSPLPGLSRVTLELDYTDLDAAQLSKIYPWDPKHVVYSRLSGPLRGWFEGRLERFEFEGQSELTAYTPQPLPGVIALPATGTMTFVARPGEVDLAQSDIRFFETAIQADGRIREMQADLNVHLKSANLANLFFIYKEANGEGSFDGTLKGAIQTPTLSGNIVLDRYKHGEWTIQHAEGAATLDTLTNLASVTSLRVNIGQSVALLSGTTSIDGSNMNLRVQSDRIMAQDFASVLKEKVEGVLSGDVVVTSASPLKLRGHVTASRLSARGRTFEAIEADVTVADPSIELERLTMSERGARLTGGRVRFNRTTEDLEAEVNVASLDLNRTRDLGIPDTLQGIIQRAHLTVSGNLQRYRIGGDATIENLSFRGEVFPRANLRLSTEWPNLTAVLSEARNVNLTAKINLSDSDYPFEASAKFDDYSLEKLARFGHGSLTASGEAQLSGALKGSKPVSGTGTIREIHARIEDYPFDSSRAFAFRFDANQLQLIDEATLNGPLGTRVNIRGSVGLTNSPTLDLRANGNLDLRVFAELNPNWSITGIVDFNGSIGGSTEKPNIDGLATFKNASLGYEGVYTTLSMLNGDVRFNGNRVLFENLEGRVSGGTIKVRGSGVIQNQQMEGLNVRIDTDRVRFRYPAGLTSVITGPLELRGTSSEPAIAGNLTIDSMVYRSEFESFLAIFRAGGLDSGGTALDRLRLGIHVSGNRGINIQNELAEVNSARVELDIRGTLGSPSLTGHVEASEGTLLFQGKRYEITRGNIDFVDPLRIDPIVDLQAESDLRDYRVILSVEGRGENVRVELRSDPPLPQLELVTLIAGGKTLRELEGAGATKLPTSEELFQGTAASVLVDLLQSRLGNRFGLLGLDRVRIDPYLVGAGNKSAQITLSVTRDLSVTYSQDLSSNQQRVIQVEYFLSKNLSLVASREENNETTALGLDIRLRKRF